MRKIAKRAAAGAVLGGSLLFTGGLGIASAAPGTNVDDDLVNLGVGNGDVLQDLNAGTAAQIAGLLCGTTANTNGPDVTGMANGTDVNANDVTALANQVDAGQIPTTTCDSPQGVVTISQNGPATSPNAANVPAAGPSAENAPGLGGDQSSGPMTAPTPTTAPSPSN